MTDSNLMFRFKQGGDAWARYQVRIAEIEESLKIIEQAVEQFPKDGPIMAKGTKGD